MGLPKYIMTCIHHYSIIPSTFTALKILFCFAFDIVDFKIHLEVKMLKNNQGEIESVGHVHQKG